MIGIVGFVETILTSFVGYLSQLEYSLGLHPLCFCALSAPIVMATVHYCTTETQGKIIK